MQNNGKLQFSKGETVSQTIETNQIGYFVINYHLNKKWLSLKLRIYITVLSVKTNL